MNFWEKMKNSGEPILCLAPMADVTDSAFRYIIAKYSKSEESQNMFSSLSTDISLLGNSSARLSQPAQGTLEKIFCDSYITYTEFVSADGLVLAPEEGRKKLLKDLEYSEIERPIVAQFFTSKPEMMEKAAELAVELGFDGIDINMGCPDKSVEKQGAGATLIKNPLLARQLIRAAKEGVSRGALVKWGNTNKAIPISVKTRLGYNKDELEEWLPELLAESPVAIVIHARTRKEMSKVPADWSRIKRAVEIRNEIQNFSTPHFQKSTDISLLRNSSCSLQSSSQGIFENVVPKNQKTLIIGNGDVKDVEDALQKCKESGADGAMIGRGIFGKPYLFSNSRELENKNNPEVVKKILQILLEHTKLFDEKLGPPAGGVKNFSVMKKHFKAYLKNPEEKKLRVKLMEAPNAKEAEEIILKYLS